MPPESRSLSSACGNTLEGGPHVSSSPSPRLVPLTVLSQDGTPVKTRAMNAMPSSLVPSPLWLDVEEASQGQDKASVSSPAPVTKMPGILSLLSPPATNQSDQPLPRIKLTPRGRDSFLPVRLSPSPRGGACDDMAMPRLRPRPTRVKAEEEPPNIINATSSLMIASPGSEVAAEMDSLLNGFGHHNAPSSSRDPDRASEIEDAVDKAESEEAEMVAIAQGPVPLSTLWLPPVRTTPETREERRFVSTISNGDTCASQSPGDKPVPSIAFNNQRVRQGTHSKEDLPIPKSCSCSFFESPTNNEGPVERLIRADAITDAARLEKPLVDNNKSNINADNAGFMLCLPQKNQSRASAPADKPPPSYSSLVLPKSESYEKNVLETEEDLPCLNKRQTSDGYSTPFCSLSGCDHTNIMASPKYSRTRALGATKDRLSVSSVLSSSSLYGFDIVHQDKTSLGNQCSQNALALSQSKSSEEQALPGTSRPLRSELSSNSLGFSVDSADIGANQRELCTPQISTGLRVSKQISPRDLFTPPVVGGGGTSQHRLSPPPLRLPAHYNPSL